MDRTVALLCFPKCQVIDVVGPLEVFAQAARFGAATPYRVELLAPAAGLVESSGGVRLHADAAMAERPGPFDTLLVAGGAGVHDAAADPAVLGWLRRAAEGSRRVGSVCTGAFVLAAAGLLDGRRATTHWRSCARLAEQYPTVAVEPDAIHVRDGNLYSSAGVTAGMDLALSMVEADCGAEVAMAIARNLVVYLRRAGGQSQYSPHLAGEAARTPPITAVQAWILDNLDKPMRIPDLAWRAAMSPRNFARVFVAELGMTPGRFVERARVDAARWRLCAGSEPIELVAAGTGFATAEAMRRAFKRQLGVTPQDYRERFGA